VSIESLTTALSTFGSTFDAAVLTKTDFETFASSPSDVIEEFATTVRVPVSIEAEVDMGVVVEAIVGVMSAETSYYYPDAKRYYDTVSLRASRSVESTLKASRDLETNVDAGI